MGPGFLESSGEGVLLILEPSLVESAPRQWTVTGSVKYISSKNHFVPEGEAAIEMVSVASSGIQTALTLTEGFDYNLEFMVGDANDSCSGEFITGFQAGSAAQNYSLQSTGTGSVTKYSMTFKGSPTSTTQIKFVSYRLIQREDGVFCGPVINGVLLQHASHGYKFDLQTLFLIPLLLVALAQIK